MSARKERTNLPLVPDEQVNLMPTPDQPNTERACPRCGRALAAGPADAPMSGLCPKCLLSALFPESSGEGASSALADVLKGALRSSNPNGPGPHGVPRIFAGYELVEEIARGGMGIVYRAHQRAAGRMVALKVLAAGHFASPEFIRRFRTEAETVATLDHPNIVPTYEVGEQDGHPFFSMKFVLGGSLAQKLAALESPMAERAAQELVVKLARAVHYAHQRGVMHRDIKPGNVLLDARGEPHLTDFGLAKLVEKDSTLTRSLAMLGTPSYMSPEQARGEAKQLTTAVDIYGLGAVFYELLTGQPPYGGGTTMEIVRRVLETEPRRPSTLRPGLSRDLETICLKCLEKDPQRRYSSAEALAADLERWRNREPIVARPVSPLERTAKWIQRNRASFVALVTIALLLVTGTGVSTWQAIEATRARRAEAKQREVAEGAQARAEAQLTRSEWLVYAGNLMLAQSDFENGNGGLARHYLEECDMRLRGWEHRYLWSRINAKQTFSGHGRSLTSVAFSPDGRRIVTGSEDRTARVWDAATGEELLVLNGHKGLVLSVAFSPDGRRILTGGGEWALGIKPGEAKIWDAGTGQELFELKGHNYSVWCGTFSPDGQRIVTGAGDRGKNQGETKVWDAVTGLELFTLSGCADGVRSVTFSHDGQRILTSGHAARMWDAASGQEVRTLHGYAGGVNSVAFSPDDKQVVAGCLDHAARVWDAVTGRLVLVLEGHDQEVASVAFSPDGQRVATGSADQMTKLWDPVTGDQIFTLKGHAGFMRGMAFSPDGKSIVTVSDETLARMWDAEMGQEIPSLKGHKDFVSSIAFSPDSRSVLTGSGDGTMKIWDVRTSRETRTIRGAPSKFWSEAGVWGVAISPDGQRAVTGSNDRMARVWDLATGRQLLALQHTGVVSCVAFSPDGKRIVTGVGEWGIPNRGPGAALVWDATTGRTLLDLGHTKVVWSVAISPDGQRIVTGSGDSIARVWDSTTGREILALRGHTAALHSVAFSPDGQRILTGSQDKTAKVWDVASGEELLTLKGHTGIVRSVAFGPNSRRIVTGGDDRTARLWNAATGEEAMALRGHSERVWSVAFSPNGQWIATGIAGAGAMVTLWFAPPTP